MEHELDSSRAIVNPQLDLTPLRSAIAGEVIDRAHREYDVARRLWNAMIDKHPAAIVRCQSRSDVIAAIRFARQAGLKVAVRAGGHSAPGHSMCNGGLVVDLSEMRGVQIDPERRIAVVAGGARLADLDREARKFGLATPAGAVSHTGVGGLTLGGGMGRLMRKHGLTVDNLLAAEVVTAAGHIVHTDAHTEPELFWALRGGGGNFGVVTEFTFRLHEVPDPYVAMMIHTPDTAAAVLRRWRQEMAAGLPNDLMWASFVRVAGGLPGLPAALEGRPCLVSLLEWYGEPQQGRALLERLVADLAPAFHVAGPMPYLRLQTLMDEATRPGGKAYSKAGFFDEIPDELIDRLLRCGQRTVSARSFIEVIPLGGAVAQVDPQATAFPHRRSRFVFNVVGLWDPQENDARNIAWVRESYAAIESFTAGGAYVNYMGGDEGDVDVAYGQGPTLARLRESKLRFDPDNLFCFNYNVKPRLQQGISGVV